MITIKDKTELRQSVTDPFVWYVMLGIEDAQGDIVTPKLKELYLIPEVKIVYVDKFPEED